jgi:DNA-binding transcriptional regulator GbsR (MarR family)
MTVQEGKQKFIESWGAMSSGWGINPAMAQVHALLLISPEAITADQVKQELNISTGNVSMNLRALLEWGLVYKQMKMGERREYYYAEKDMWQVLRQIIINRKKRELEPMIKVLDELSEVGGGDPESEAFCEVVRDLRKFSHKANNTLDMLIKADANWLTSALMGVVVR